MAMLPQWFDWRIARMLRSSSVSDINADYSTQAAAPAASHDSAYIIQVCNNPNCYFIHFNCNPNIKSRYAHFIFAGIKANHILLRREMQARQTNVH
jgi:hypothetical protein